MHTIGQCSYRLFNIGGEKNPVPQETGIDFGNHS